MPVHNCANVCKNVCCTYNSLHLVIRVELSNRELQYLKKCLVIKFLLVDLKVKARFYGPLVTV